MLQDQPLDDVPVVPTRWAAQRAAGAGVNAASYAPGKAQRQAADAGRAHREQGGSFGSRGVYHPSLSACLLTALSPSLMV